MRELGATGFDSDRDFSVDFKLINESKWKRSNNSDAINEKTTPI